MDFLYDSLIRHCEEDYYPFHMPGHKRRLGSMADPFSYDVTEIEGFDNLHHAEGILAQAQGRAAALYGSEETYFLVNGSTCGILSAISACAPEGKILLARNCHKAAYHALWLNRLEAEYLYPIRRKDGINGEIRPEDVKEKLEKQSGIKAVFLTSPTYDGVISDIRAIADIAHQFGIPLIVDSAHGAHFGMHPDFPENAVKLGADLVIHSLHKTLPSLTQTALLHVNGELVCRDKIRKMLGIYQSSSPSYVLMASMDECVRMLQEDGARLFDGFAGKLQRFWSSAEDLQHFRPIRTEDPSKLVISTQAAGLTGVELKKLLYERYHLEMEMAAGSYVLGLSSVGDAEEGFRRLSQALHELDLEYPKETLADVAKIRDDAAESVMPCNEICMTIWEAENRKCDQVRLEESEGHIFGEFIYLYPPGIPLIVPGERMNRHLLDQILCYRERGFALQGTQDYRLEYVSCVKERQG